MRQKERHREDFLLNSRTIKQWGSETRIISLLTLDWDLGASSFSGLQTRWIITQADDRPWDFSAFTIAWTNSFWRICTQRKKLRYRCRCRCRYRYRRRLDFPLVPFLWKTLTNADWPSLGLGDNQILYNLTRSFPPSGHQWGKVGQTSLQNSDGVY